MNRLFLLFISVITIGAAAHAMEHLSLIEAARDGKLDVVQQRIAQGEDINQTDNGRTALIRAAIRGHLSVVELLIESGAAIDQTDNGGGTALMCAAYFGRLSVVEHLIKAGADIDQKDNKGQTALIYAAKGSELACCQALVHSLLRQPSQEQKNAIYEFLLCMKEMHGTQYSNVRNIFKPHLQALIKEENKPKAIAEIEKNSNQDIKNQLLELCQSQELK